MASESLSAVSVAIRCASTGPDFDVGRVRVYVRVYVRVCVRVCVRVRRRPGERNRRSSRDVGNN